MTEKITQWNTEPLINIENKNSKKTVDLKGEKTEQKTGDLSNQMAYLGTLNRIKVNIKPQIPKDNIAFTGSNISSLSDEEFEKLKKEIQDKLNQNPKLQDYLNVEGLNKNNIFLADKILSDERIFNNPYLIKNPGKISYTVNHAKTPEKAQIANKILSDERLYNNPEFMKRAPNIVIHAETPKIAEITDKILSDERMFNNPEFMKDAILCVIYGSDNSEKLQAKSKLLSKIYSNEKLYNNPNFKEIARKIINLTSTDKESRAKCKLIDKILSDERLYNNSNFMNTTGDLLYFTCTNKQAKRNCKLIEKSLNDKEFEIIPEQLIFLISEEPELSYKELKQLNKTIGRENAFKLLNEDIVLASKFLSCYKKQDINKISLAEKRNLLRNLVACNSNLFDGSENLHKMFPLLPKNQDEYCSLLPSIVRSAGIETNTLSDREVEDFNKSLNNLGAALKNISDEEFNNLNISQEYSKDDFILDTLDKVKNLSSEERQKVYDYFGFELHHNKNNKTGFSITGYPVNLNNGEKLAQITDPKTKDVVEDLRKNVVRFSENNPIISKNKEVEVLLNEIISSLPELRPLIGRSQSQVHDFDVMQHSLKVMKGIVQDPNFEKLNNSDKKLMLLASCLHDITKREGTNDKTHEREGSFDSFFIAKKFNLTKEEEIKLNTLIKNHEWLGRVNTSKDKEELIKNIQSTAYDLRHDNLFDLSLMFTHADLKAVKKDNSFHNKKEGKSRIDFNGNVRSFGESADYYAEKIKDCIKELQKSQPLLPTTKLPSLDEIKSKISTINEDGSTNIKGVYEDKDGAVIIKYNEVEDWQKLGFQEGSISKGIKCTTKKGVDVDTGNIKFIAHGLKHPNELVKFDAFSLLDSDALLSVSYMERPESKYRLFRPQGVLLDVDTKYIHGGGETDSGSGCCKSIQTFKDDYIFGAKREKDRLFVSDLIKKAANMNDEEYVKFVEENANKTFKEIEPADLREKLIKAFASINSHKRSGEREYNEMYVSNPKLAGVFAYNEDENGKINNPLDFLNSAEVSKRVDFLKKYAVENNLPFVIFGD